MGCLKSSSLMYASGSSNACRPLAPSGLSATNTSRMLDRKMVPRAPHLSSGRRWRGERQSQGTGQGTESAKPQRGRAEWQEVRSKGAAKRSLLKKAHLLPRVRSAGPRSSSCTPPRLMAISSPWSAGGQQATHGNCERRQGSLEASIGWRMLRDTPSHTHRAAGRWLGPWALAQHTTAGWLP